MLHRTYAVIVATLVATGASMTLSANASVGDTSTASVAPLGRASNAGVAGLPLANRTTAAKAQKSKVVVTVRTPTGVPGTVALRSGRQRKVVAKPATGRMRRAVVVTAPGKWTVSAPDVVVNGRPYTAVVSRGQVTTRTGHRVRVTAKYRSLVAVSALRVSTMTKSSVTVTWAASGRAKRAPVQVRRTNGQSAATSVRSGVAVRVNGRTATSDGAKPGSTYTFALFVKQRGKWVQALTTVTSTPAPKQPNTVMYSARPGTVWLPRGTRLLPGSDGVTVRFPNGVTPVVGAPVVIPSGSGGSGFRGVVIGVRDDGRVRLRAATIPEVFTAFRAQVTEFPTVQASSDGNDVRASGMSCSLEQDLLTVIPQLSFDDGNEVPLEDRDSRYELDFSEYTIDTPVFGPVTAMDLGRLRMWGRLALHLRVDLGVTQGAISCTFAGNPMTFNVPLGEAGNLAIVATPAVEVSGSVTRESAQSFEAVTGFDFDGTWRPQVIGPLIPTLVPDVLDPPRAFAPFAELAPGDPSLEVNATVKAGANVKVGEGLALPFMHAVLGVNADLWPVVAEVKYALDAELNSCFTTSVRPEAEVGLGPSLGLGNDWTLDPRASVTMSLDFLPTLNTSSPENCDSTPTPTPSPTAPPDDSFDLAVDGASAEVTFKGQKRIVGRLSNAAAGRTVTVYATSHDDWDSFGQRSGEIWIEDGAGDIVGTDGDITGNPAGDSAVAYIPSDVIRPLRVVLVPPPGWSLESQDLSMLTASTVDQDTITAGGTSRTLTVSRAGQEAQVDIRGIKAGDTVSITPQSSLTGSSRYGSCGDHIWLDHAWTTVKAPDGRRADSGHDYPLRPKALTFTARQTGTYLYNWNPRDTCLGTVSITTTNSRG